MTFHTVFVYIRFSLWRWRCRNTSYHSSASWQRGQSNEQSKFSRVRGDWRRGGRASASTDAQWRSAPAFLHIFSMILFWYMSVNSLVSVFLSWLWPGNIYLASPSVGEHPAHHVTEQTELPPSKVRTEGQQMNGIIEDRSSVSSTDMLVSSVNHCLVLLIATIMFIIMFIIIIIVVVIIRDAQIDRQPIAIRQ